VRHRTTKGCPNITPLTTCASRLLISCWTLSIAFHEQLLPAQLIRAEMQVHIKLPHTSARECRVQAAPPRKSLEVIESLRETPQKNLHSCLFTQCNISRWGSLLSGVFLARHRNSSDRTAIPSNLGAHAPFWSRCELCNQEWAVRFRVTQQEVEVLQDCCDRK